MLYYVNSISMYLKKFKKVRRCSTTTTTAQLSKNRAHTYSCSAVFKRLMLF